MYSPKGGAQIAPPTPTPSNALYQPSGSDNAIAQMMPIGQGRATNTIQLRQMYTDYAAQMQESGQEPMSFEQWAESQFPDQKILNQ